MKRLIFAATAVLTASAAQPGLAADPALRIENAAARLIVVPEARADVSYVIAPGRAALPPLRPRRDGGGWILDGGLGGGFGVFGLHAGLSCQGSGEHARVRIPGHGEVALHDLPVITAKVPMNAHVSAGTAVFGEIGPTNALELGLAGCGDWKIADVKGPLRLQLAGSGDVRGASAGAATVNIAGSNDVYLGVLGPLDAKISGSGDLHAGAVNGPLSAKITGSGDISIDSGRSATLTVAIAGSGDVRYRGTAGALSASIAGSGDVDVAHVTGAVSKHIVGSGDVNFGR